MTRPTLLPLPLPQFFDGKRAADYAYRPDAAMLAGSAADWRAQHAIRGRSSLIKRRPPWHSQPPKFKRAPSSPAW